jgi:hypothetical protein
VFGPLMQRIEAHLGLAEPVRVALVANEEIFELDLADAVSATMKISGTVANAHPGFSRHSISATDTSKADAVRIKLLTEIRPHVIISAAGDEFVGLMSQLEIAWSAVVVGVPPPFYVLSIENRFSNQLTELVKAKPALGSRLVGVNYASAQDTTLRDAYLKRFESAFPTSKGIEGFENFYDTMYFLLYAFVGAGNVATYTGNDVARGMTRLLSGPLEVDVDPQQISYGTSALKSDPNTKIALQGTLGPPNFDPGSGARKSEGSVWCLDATASHVDDVLRLNETGQLVGDFPCFAF